MQNTQSSNSLPVRIQVAATWKYEADDNATDTCLFTARAHDLYSSAKPPFLLPHKSKPELKKAALHEYLAQRKVWTVVNVHQLL